MSESSVRTDAAEDSRPVVVGVDESDSARDAADWAADVAALWRAPLHLVHAILGERDDAPVEVVPGWLREVADAAERSGVPATSIEIVPGGIGELLVERSDSARLVVVGSYGEGAWTGMLAGSTALSLIGRAGCPVVVVRGPAPQLPPRRSGPLVVGVDGSPAGAAALESAVELAAGLGARLVAVHTWSDVEADATGGVHRLPDPWDALAARATARLEAALGPVVAGHQNLPVERQVVNDSPLRALLDRARDARLLVVGHRGLAQRPGMLLGSTSRALVEFAACPVMVVKPAPAPDEERAARAATAPPRGVPSAG